MDVGLFFLLCFYCRFAAIGPEERNDCKVRTQEAENFDEEDKSLLSA